MLKSIACSQWNEVIPHDQQELIISLLMSKLGDKSVFIQGVMVQILGFAMKHQMPDIFGPFIQPLFAQAAKYS